MVKKAQSPTKQSAVKLLFWVVILLIGAGLLVMPIMKNSTLKKDIVQAQNDLLKAQKFSDVYAQLVTIEEDLNGLFQHLQMPEQGAITTATFDNATQNLIETIKASNLTPPEEGFEILSGSLGDYEGQVLVTAEFVGNFTDAWGFFVTLGAIPYVKHIQSIDMEDRFEAISCRLALRLSVSRSE